MFQLRPAHFEAFDRAVRREWHWHLADTMREIFPKQTETLDPELLLERIAKADAAALKYRITSQAGIMRFVGIGFLAGENYYESDAIRCGLLHPHMDPEIFIQQLSEGIPDALQQTTKPSTVAVVGQNMNPVNNS
jgi:hypothetical protein